MKRIELRLSRAEQAYQAILDEIADGALAPGTHLVQELGARIKSEHDRHGQFRNHPSDPDH